MPWLTPENANAPVICRRVFIPNEFLSVVDGALTMLTLPYNWEQFGALTPDECAEIMLDMYNDYLREACPVAIGAILPFATTDPPQGSLECDGAEYLREDYPLLYAVLDAVFIVDADHFVVPDLRGRVVLGAGTGGGLSTYSVGEAGGIEAVTLDIGAMPSHSHTNTPHTHTEITAVAAIINGGLEAPAAAAVPGAGITGATSVTIDSTGGGGSHENRQPFIALRHCIYWT